MEDPVPIVDFGIANWTVLLAYLAAMLGIGAVCAGRLKTTDDFFLAGQRIPAWAAALSIFGTQLSAITFMAIPATTYADNWVRFTGQIMILPVLVIVIYGYLPFFRRLKLATAYEYLERRFDRRVRWFGSALFLLMQFGRMGIVLYLPAVALATVTGMSLYTCIGLMGLLATAYTVLGGVEAVIWTDVAQVIVLFGGALLCVAQASLAVGGVGEVVGLAVEHDKLQLFLDGWDPREMVPWVMVVGLFFNNLIPYSTDQTVVQRYLTTRDERQARRSLWINFGMTLPAALVFFFLGTALFAFYTSQPDLALPTRNDQIVPWFVVHQLPPGVAGLVIAGIFAASMSSLDSSMNSMATALISDFYRPWAAHVTDQQCLRVARGLTVLLGTVGTGLAMVLATLVVGQADDDAPSQFRLAFDLFNQILGLFGGSLSGVFILGVFTRRTDARAALCGALAGAAVTAGIVFFGPISAVIASSLGRPIAWPSWLLLLTSVNLFLHAAVGTVICVVVGCLVSRWTSPHAIAPAGTTIFDLRQRD